MIIIFHILKLYKIIIDHTLSFEMFGLGFFDLSLFISPKKLALLLYLTLVVFKLFFFVFIIAFASNLVIPPYSIFLFSFFLSDYFLRCLAILLFFSLFYFLFSSFYDSNLVWISDASVWPPFQRAVGTLYSTITASSFSFETGLGVKWKFDKESR